MRHRTAKKDKRALPFVKKLGFLACIAFFAILILEIGLRVTGFRPGLPTNRIRVGANAYFWISDRELGFRNRPNGSYRYDEINSNPLVTTDESGFRNGHGWQADTRKPVVVFVGDSTVFCAEVEDDQTAPSEVAKLLTREFDVSVLNAGVRGYSTLQAKRMLKECLARYDVCAAVYCFCANDYEENVKADIYYPAQAPTIRWDAQRRVFVEVEISDPAVSWGQDFLPLAVEEQRRKLAGRPRKRPDQVFRDRLREHSALLHFAQSAASGLKNRLREGESAGGEVRADDSYQLGNEACGDETMVHVLEQMQSMCLDEGAVFLATVFSERHGHRSFGSWCRAAGVRFVPVHDGFVDRPMSYHPRLRDGGYDPHYNPKGTRTFAKALCPVLREILSERLP